MRVTPPRGKEPGSDSATHPLFAVVLAVVLAAATGLLVNPAAAVTVFVAVIGLFAATRRNPAGQ